MAPLPQQPPSLSKSVKPKAPPLPTRFNPAIRQQQRSTPNQPDQPESSPSEREQITAFYYQAYGPKQGERYKDLYFLEKELEALKASGANFQQVFETQKAINAKIQDIGRTNQAGESAKTKGPGINTTIKREGGVVETLYSSNNGQQRYVSVPKETPSPSQVLNRLRMEQTLNNQRPRIVQNAIISGQFGVPGVNTIQTNNTPAQLDRFQSFFAKGQSGAQQIIQAGKERPISKEYGITGPALEFIGGGVSGIYGASEFVSAGLGSIAGVPEARTRSQLYGTQIRGAISEAKRDPIVFGGKVIESLTSELAESPYAFAGKTVVSAKVLDTVAGPVLNPLSRGVKTTISRVEERFSPTIYRAKSFEILPTSSVPFEVGELNSIAGKKLTTTHVTFASRFGQNFPTKVIRNIQGKRTDAIRLTGGKTSSLSEYRQIIEQKSFYEYPGNGALGGFAGFGPAGSGSKKVFSLFGEQPIVLVRRATIFQTPQPSLIGVPKGSVTIPGGRGTGPLVRQLTPAYRKAIGYLAEQEKFTTRTFQGAENLAGISIEKQVTSPVFVESFPITLRAPSRGATLLLKEAGTKFARRTVESPAFLPKIVRESDLFVESVKFKVFEARKIPIRGPGSITSPQSIQTIDVSTLAQAGPSSPAIQSINVSSVVSKKAITGNLSKLASSVSEPNRSISSPIVSRSAISNTVSIPSRPVYPTSKQVSYAPTSSPNNGFTSPPLPPISPPSFSRTPSNQTSPANPPRSPPRTPPSIGSPPVSLPRSFGSSTTQVKRRETKTFRSLPPLEQGFTTYFLTGGKRGEKVSKTLYTYKDAFNIGAIGVQGSIKRTFEIVPEGLAYPRNIQGPTNILRPGKVPGTFVEKTQFAINTPFEKKSLRTARKQATNYRQGKLEGFFPKRDRAYKISFTQKGKGMKGFNF